MGIRPRWGSSSSSSSWARLNKFTRTNSSKLSPYITVFQSRRSCLRRRSQSPTTHLPRLHASMHVACCCTFGQNGAQDEVNVTSASQSQKTLCRIHRFPAQIVADRPLHFLMTSLATQQVCLERLMWSLKRCSAVNASQVPPPHPSTSTVFLHLCCFGVSRLLSFKSNGTAATTQAREKMFLRMWRRHLSGDMHHVLIYEDSTKLRI